MTFARFAKALRNDRNAQGLVVLSTIGSTNDLAKRIVREYAREGDAPPLLDIVAWHQETGRGRDDRRWSCQPGGGVYASMIRPLDDPSQAAQLPVAVAVGLGATLNRHLDGRCRLKWPNDLLVERRKLGGVLIEVIGQGDGRPGAAIIGFGVNHDAAIASDPELSATSFAQESQREMALAPLANELLEGVDAALAGPFADVLETYRALSAHRQGEAMRLRGPREPVTGTFLGFDQRGFLRLGMANGEERLMVAGEVDG